MKKPKRRWYCYVCGKPLPKSYVITSLSDHTDRTFLAHVKCSDQFEDEAYLVRIREVK